MCMSAPDIPTPPAPAQFQAVQQPVTLTSTRSPSSRRIRGLYASLFTSPQGIVSKPKVTGGGGGLTGA